MHSHDEEGKLVSGRKAAWYSSTCPLSTSVLLRTHCPPAPGGPVLWPGRTLYSAEVGLKINLIWNAHLWSLTWQASLGPDLLEQLEPRDAWKTHSEAQSQLRRRLGTSINEKPTFQQFEEEKAGPARE